MDSSIFFVEREVIKTTEDDEEGKADMRIHPIGTAARGFHPLGIKLGLIC